jgi:hypothetical protein
MSEVWIWIVLACLALIILGLFVPMGIAVLVAISLAGIGFLRGWRQLERRSRWLDY